MKKLIALLIFAAAMTFGQTVQTVRNDPLALSNTNCNGAPVLQYNETNGHLSTCIIGTGWVTTTYPGAAATLARTDSAQTFTGVQTFSSKPVMSGVTNTGTVTFPTTTGGVPVVIACGSTTTGAGTCANTAAGATAKVYFGAATLASNAQVITLGVGYTGATTFYCVANDITTRANPVQAVPTTAATFTITNDTGASDVVQWVCVGY